MEQTIVIPEGYKLVQVSATEYRIQKEERILPKTWEEFCKLSPFIKKEEHFINSSSCIIANSNGSRDPIVDANMLPSKDVAEAILTLCQLIQLRDYYNNGWKADWNNDRFDKYCIGFENEEISTSVRCANRSVLVFKTEKLRNEFLKNFKDLIVKLKPLYP